MSESEDSRGFILDVITAILLGVFTSLAAFAAYQAALWGGNQATAYTEATNILGEANRELLRGVQEQAFDTTVWIEHMKAENAEKNAAVVANLAPVAVAAAAAAAAPAEAGAAAEEGAAGEEGAPADKVAPPDKGAPAAPKRAEAPAAEPQAVDEEELPKEKRAELLAAELAFAADESLVKRLDRLQQSRRELVAAIKWSKEQHEKRTKLLQPAQRLELARKLVDLFEKSDRLGAEYDGALEKAGLTGADELELSVAVEKNPAVKAQLDKLDKDALATQAAIDAEMEKLAAPMFFKSTTYTRSREAKYTELMEKGNKTFLEGQKYNGWGDRFTLTTVFYTVALFFSGLASVVRRSSIKVAFLVIGVVITSGALWYMVKTPFA